MLKYELNKNKSNRHANVDEEKPRKLQTYMKNNRQLKNMGNGRNSHPQGRTCQLVNQNQRVSPENIYRSNIIQTEQNMHIHTHITTSNVKRSKFDRAQVEIIGRFKGGNIVIV